MSIFRIHYSDQTTLDIEAENPAQAREIAKIHRTGIITKVKIVKENASAR